MSKQKGEVFHIAGKVASSPAHERPVGVPVITRAGPTNDFDAFTDAWPLFKWAVWSWLWERKNKSLRIWGPFRFKYRRFRGLVEMAIGSCPFDWKKGPEYYAS